MPDVALARTLAYAWPSRTLLTLMALDASIQMRSGHSGSRMWRRREVRPDEILWHDCCNALYNKITPMTFAEKFCAQRRVSPENFVDTVLRLTLRPTARFLSPLLNCNPDYFAADREFVECVGRISRIESFDSEAFDFITDATGRGFLHRKLRLRVSRRRLRNLVYDTMQGCRAAPTAARLRASRSL